MSLLAAGCGGSGELTGTLFLSTVGGQPKRGTDVLVTVVPLTSRLAEELSRMEADFSKSVAPAMERYEEAKRAYDDADRRLLRLHKEAGDAVSQALASMRTHTDEVKVVREKYRDRVRALLKSQSTLKTGRTDVNGTYTFANLPTGRILVFVEWASNEYASGVGSFLVTHVWMVPIEIARGPNKLDLSGSNSGAFWKR